MSLGVKNGVTYYSDFQNMKAISSPIVDNNVQMKYKGHFTSNWDKYTVKFDSFGYGMKKTRSNQGCIFCNDASKLFSITRGYVGMILSLPYDINSGVYYPLSQNANVIREHILWGVNVDKIRSSFPCVSASLTSSGIEFFVWSSYCSFSVVNSHSDLPANTDIFMEFIWDSDGLEEYVDSDYDATMLIRINGEDIVLGNAPIASNSIEDLSFYALETPFTYSNLECTIKKLIIGNEVPSIIEDEWYSSSTSSESV